MNFLVMNFRFSTFLAACATLPLLTSCGDEPTPVSTEDTSPAALPDLDAGHQLSADQIHNAGIQSVAAVAKTLTTKLLLPAMASENLDEQAHVNSTLPGVVIHIEAELGHEVNQGDLMCTIRSAALAQAVANLHLARTVLATSMQMQERELALHERGVALARATEQRELQLAKEGFGTARDLAAAQIALQEAELARDRRSLELEQQIAHQNETLTAAMAQLRAWGFDDHYAETAEATIGVYSLFATKPGVVMERHITEGEFVDAQTELFLIQGMEIVWMLAAVYENQIRFIDEGLQTDVRFNAYPDLLFEGVIDHIHHDLDVDTRSVKARVQIRNVPIAGRHDPHPLLPGMYGTIEVATGTTQAAVTIPDAAVLHDGDRNYVFTTDGNGTFRRRYVEIGMRTDLDVEIKSGIQAGEQVVIEGLFILESLLHADAIGEGE